MSPARIAEESEQDKQILALARGFDTLIETIQKLTWQERELRSKLQFAHDEYLKLADQLPNRSASRTEVAEKILPLPFQKNNYDVSTDTTGWIYDVEKAGYLAALEFEAIAKGLDAYRSLADRRTRRDIRDGHHQNANTCLVAVDAKARSSIERDFTTNGVRGNLQCPFAIPNGHGVTPSTLANGNLDSCAQVLDPIRAESLQGTHSASVRDAVPRCPIRYLDDHSPEEVAKYFQNHKHEIPRSHAICIQRYQKDSQSIRQLDEKYGDMVNMIKGLGLYHQPYLPSTEEHSRPGGTESVSVGRVEKWAEDVSAKSSKLEEVMSPSHERGNGEVEERRSYFERPLRDVRVGESPSRPWGIHVPVSQEVAQSSIVSLNAPTGADYEKTAPDISSISTPIPRKSKTSLPAGRCPFHTLAPKEVPPGATAFPGSLAANLEKQESPELQPPNFPNTPLNPHETRSPPSPPVQPKMVFQGPVFFGYSAEQAATLIQKLGHSSGLK
ncbi:hypothetical protein PAAG_06903 [Paracoccidioides lutzii Pb01]|uniref:Uncharacterized protein n=1 Tax=Paracoccidioides lutzii (strain ATCC MYA-826 / Pb01) TaxID=502779 RepID=C1H812_PARBA|nr:hypothetical protein PAAG_06903 [Paracoccidioides lutzii Pb01]EEH36485.1 hypothetical protein PAAG_06903 [Paracoccidioides lutzii Pb01]